MKKIFKKIILLISMLVFSFNILSANDIPLSKDTEDKILYCGLNSYIDSIGKFKSFYGELYVKNRDRLLRDKIDNSELGDVSYDKDGFNALLEKIKKYKDFCKNRFFIQTKLKVLKYDKNGKFFPLEGITKMTKYDLGDGSFYQGVLTFTNVDESKNKIILSGSKAKDFLKHIGMYRGYLARVYFYISSFELVSENSGIKVNLEASLDKIDFIDKTGKIYYTIKYDNINKTFNNNPKKVTLLNSFIKLKDSKFVDNGFKSSDLVDLLVYIYSHDKKNIDYNKLLKYASKRVYWENNKFRKKKLMKEIEPDLKELVQKVKDNNFTIDNAFLIQADYDLDKGCYKPKYEIKDGYLTFGSYTFKLPKKDICWKVDENKAEQIANIYNNNIAIEYKLKLKPIGLKKEETKKEKLSLEQMAFVGLTGKKKDIVYIELGVISGTKELIVPTQSNFQISNYNKKVLLKDTI